MTSREIYDECIKISSELLRCNFGIPYLDDALLGMAPGEVTLVGARTGGGKTEFATQVVLEQNNQNRDRVKSVLYFALDHDRGEIERRILWRLIVDQIKASDRDELKSIPLRYAAWMAGQYRGVFDDLERDGKTYLNHLLACGNTEFIYKKGELTPRQIAGIIRQKEYAHISLFIVDHFHAMKFEGNAIEAQGEAISELTRAAEESFRPILLLGQFRKGQTGKGRSPIPEMEEFSGHSNLIYLPQNIVILAPRHIEGSNHWDTYFRIEKARSASDAKAFVGVHGFDMETKRYSEKYEVYRHVPLSEPKPITQATEIPKWATHGNIGKDTPRIKAPFGRERRTQND